ncbi:MAG TPA: TorF family putative porin [Crenalkalicoccus sp.]|nr:TorF family putative porin [Crenalkalicoccus sp.]
MMLKQYRSLRLRTAVFVATLTLAAGLLAAPPARAFEVEQLGLTVTATPAVVSDYLFRGISQTRNRWAGQFTADVQHASGVYVGAFLSNAYFLANPWNDTRQELDLLAGYRFPVGPVNMDIGYIAYLYPGQDKAPGTELNEYQEVALKASYQLDIFKLLLSFNYSPNYFGRSGNGYYVEGGTDITLPYDFTGSLRLGYQWIERNPRFGTPDYLWYGISVSHEVYWGFIASVGWYDTNINKRDCAPVAVRADQGQRICDGRVVFSLSRTF